MKTNRRTFLKGLGGTMALPFLESTSLAAQDIPTRFLVVGNPYGAHPEFFFPKEFGKFGADAPISPTLSSLDWVSDRLTVLSHTDHNMVSGHGREVSFLSGVLPTEAQAFPQKNMSIDQAMALHSGSLVRYPSINFSLGQSIKMSWTPNGVENAQFIDPQKLFDHLFLNLSPGEKSVRREMLERNGSILDLVGDDFQSLKKSVSRIDLERIDQFQTSVRELEQNLNSRKEWIERDKPEYDISNHYSGGEVTVRNDYDAVFDMVSYAFETDLTRVAAISFPPDVNFTDVPGVTRSYHGCTHNGKMGNVTAELVAIEKFQVEQLSRCMKKLDAIQEPNAEGSMLDHTIILFGSGMGYGGTHSNRNLPILVAGGGFKHLGHFDCAKNGKSMPLCNLYLTLLQRFGIETDKFNRSTGAFDPLHA